MDGAQNQDPELAFSGGLSQEYFSVISTIEGSYLLW